MAKKISGFEELMDADDLDYVIVHSPSSGKNMKIKKKNLLQEIIATVDKTKLNAVEDAISEAFSQSDVDKDYISYNIGVKPDSTDAVAGTTIGAYFTTDGTLRKVKWSGSEWDEIGSPLVAVELRETNNSDDKSYKLNSYNTSNPQSKSSLNLGGEQGQPNRIGHKLKVAKFHNPSPTDSFDVNVNFTVTDQDWTNIRLIYFSELQLTSGPDFSVSGYDTSTITITPNADLDSSIDKVIAVVKGDPDQVTDDISNNRLQFILDGYDNIVNRLMSSATGAHNIITGGDHATIWGSTFSEISASGSYNAIIGGTNLRHVDNAHVSLLGGDSSINEGTYNVIYAFKTHVKGAARFNIVIGREHDVRDAADYNAIFGKDHIVRGSKGLIAGENNRIEGIGSATVGIDNLSDNYSFTGGKGSTNASDFSVMIADGGINSGEDYTQAFGIKPVVRNGGARYLGLSNSAGDVQKFTVDLHSSSIDSTGVKLALVDGSTSINVGAGVTVSIKARVTITQSDGAKSIIEAYGLYTNSGGVIEESINRIIDNGTNASDATVSIIEESAGSSSFHVTAATNNGNTASAFARVEVDEFV